jgi:hypothetical protein
MDILVNEPIVRLQDDHPEPLPYMFFHPTDIHLHEPTATLPDDHLQPPRHMSVHSMDIRVYMRSLRNL